jgi:hypothetical protein
MSLRLNYIAVGFQAWKKCGNPSVAQRPIIRTVPRIVNRRAFSFGEPIRKMAISLPKKSRFDPGVLEFPSDRHNNCHAGYQSNGNLLNASTLEPAEPTPLRTDW